MFGPAPSDNYLETLHELYNKNLIECKQYLPKLNIVYISRARFWRGVFAGEGAIDRYMREIGAHVIYPELESIDHLLRIYSNAEYIIGGEGSAFHLMQLLGRQLKNIVVIRRRADAVYFGERFLSSRCESLTYIDAVIGGISGRENGRYREEGLVVLDFDRLRKGFSDTLPVDISMDLDDFNAAVNDSMSYWLLNYWYDARTFPQESLDIVVNEARKLGVRIDAVDLKIASTKYTKIISNELGKILSEKNLCRHTNLQSLRLAITLGIAGDKTGLNVLKRSIDSEDDAEFDFGNIALALYKLGESQLAKQSILRALKKEPNTYWLWELHTHIAISLQDWDGAEKSALSGLAIDPLRPDLLFLISRIYFKSMNFHLAQINIDKAIAIRSTPHYLQLKYSIEKSLGNK